MTYRARVLEQELATTLGAMGAVLIEGAKGCGKTETARRLCQSEVLFDRDPSMRQLVELNPDTVLAGATPRLLDEWQVVPKIWNEVRREVDRRQRTGQFILTGSAQPTDDITMHTGAARIARLRMRPMTLAETGHSDGRVSLGALLQGALPGAGAAPPLAFPDVVERLAAGGWPGMQELATPQALIAMRSYADELAHADVKQLVGKRARPVKIMALLTALSRHVATSVSARTLAADIGLSEDKRESTRKTIDRYLDALERLMITEDLPGWSPHLRSRARHRTAPKRHFVDPALAVAYLRATPDTLTHDLELTGLLFESLVIRDLRVYAQANDATVAYYRDNTNLEVDAIVQHAAGPWAGFEVKLGGDAHIDAAAASLLKFRDKLNPKKVRSPALLGVVVSQGPLIRRPDGVFMIPIGVLAP
jgi:predicted AAA+ superfamily ATPase